MIYLLVFNAFIYLLHFFYEVKVCLKLIFLNKNVLHLGEDSAAGSAFSLLCGGKNMFTLLKMITTLL